MTSARSAERVPLVGGAGRFSGVDSAEHTDGEAVAGGPFGLAWREHPSDVENAADLGPDIAVELGVTRVPGSLPDGVVAGEGTRRDGVSVVRLAVVWLLAWNDGDRGRVHIVEADAGRESRWSFRARSD